MNNQLDKPTITQKVNCYEVCFEDGKCREYGNFAAAVRAIAGGEYEFLPITRE